MCVTAIPPLPPPPKKSHVTAASCPLSFMKEPSSKPVFNTGHFWYIFGSTQWPPPWAGEPRADGWLGAAAGGSPRGRA